MLEPTWPLHRLLSFVFVLNPSILFLGGRLNKVYDPGFLLQQALTPFPHGRVEVELWVTGEGVEKEEEKKEGKEEEEEERLLPRRKAVSADGSVITHWKPISLNIAS